jgi:hypothetical protein
MFPQKRGPYGNRRPFPEPYLAYPSGFPVKESSLSVPLIEIPRREIQDRITRQLGYKHTFCQNVVSTICFSLYFRKK